METTTKGFYRVQGFGIVDKKIETTTMGLHRFRV